MLVRAGTERWAGAGNYQFYAKSRLLFISSEARGVGRRLVRSFCSFPPPPFCQVFLGYFGFIFVCFGLACLTLLFFSLLPGFKSGRVGPAVPVPRLVREEGEAGGRLGLPD